jgi:hypothetical protein
MRSTNPEKERRRLEKQKQEIDSRLGNIQYDLWEIHNKLENKKGEARRELDSWSVSRSEINDNRERKITSKFGGPIRDLEAKEAALRDRKDKLEQALAKTVEEINRHEESTKNLDEDIEERKRRIQEGLGIETDQASLSESLSKSVESVRQTTTILEPETREQLAADQSKATNLEIELGVDAFRAILANEGLKEQLFNYLKEYAKERMSKSDYDVAKKIEALAEWVKQQRFNNKITEQRQDSSRCAFCGSVFERIDGSPDERALARHLADKHSDEFPI